MADKPKVYEMPRPAIEVVLKGRILNCGRELDLDMETLEEDIDFIFEEMGETFIGALDGAIFGFLKGRGRHVR